MNHFRIIFIVERGILEQQTIWSLRSLRKFGKSMADCPVSCYSPRALFYPSKKTVRELEALGASVILKNLNEDFKYYALGNKPMVLKEVTKSHPDENILFLDSDTFVLNDIHSIFSGSFDVAIAAVFKQGIGTSGAEDPNNAYWSALCEHSGLSIDKLPMVRTGVGGKEISAYYNTGVIAINRNVLSQISSTWIDLITYAIANKIFPTSGIYFVEQSTFSLSVHSLGLTIKPLSLEHNFPILTGAPDLLKSFDSDHTLIAHHQGNIELLLYFLEKKQIESEQYQWFANQYAQYSRIHKLLNKFWRWRRNTLERTSYIIQNRLK